MTGEKKKSSVLSSRLGAKRPGKSTSKNPKSSALSAITTPPRAAIASAQSKKDDVQRLKNPFNEMLMHKSEEEKDGSSSAASTLDDPEQEREGSVSGGGINDANLHTRLAELERALIVAHEEQDELRAELDKVRQHGQAYRETVDGYRHQLSGTYTQTHSTPGAFQHSPQQTSPRQRSNSAAHEQRIGHRVSMTMQRDDYIEHDYELRSKLAELEDQLVSQDAHYQAKLEQVAFKGESEWNDLTNRLHRSEKESHDRLQQLLLLKSSISSLTRVDSQVTDSALSDLLSQLANRAREWVISNFRRSKLNFKNLPLDTSKALRSIYPNYTSIDSRDRLALYQAIISNALMRIFGEPIVVGLPESGPLSPIRQLAAYIHNTGPDYRAWRRTTIRALEKSEARYALQQEREKLLHRLAGEIGHQLFTLTSINLTTVAQLSLVDILNTAADLQHTLLLQKAQYKIHFFRSEESRDMYYDDDKMESINDLDSGVDDDGDVFTDRRFLFCVFPCLEKFGDEWGENVDVSNVLLKARVCCGVG
ncbi:hypothetical protein BDV95DRAFT_605733 [Massariosphaeria phaeospora]|uniref:Uncharacterized protein n=1 Tax=Massariosphaeria phaeospora TaxID=100035 RepID=A0A7C8I8A2_9PLEO|nr:hypothetical protein BDV95DRAFT_605733 [Massariosphaeria phaeospora]